MPERAKVFRCVASSPGMRPGDDVVYNPKSPRVFNVVRGISAAAVRSALHVGALQPLGDEPIPEELVETPKPKAPKPGRPTRAAWLRIVDGTKEA